MSLPFENQAMIFDLNASIRKTIITLNKSTDKNELKKKEVLPLSLPYKESMEFINPEIQKKVKAPDSNIKVS